MCVDYDMYTERKNWVNFKICIVKISKGGEVHELKNFCPYIHLCKLLRGFRSRELKKTSFFYSFLWKNYNR